MRRDFLLSLAVEGLYRPLWSAAILEELRECEHEKLLDRLRLGAQAAGERADHLIDQMQQAFPDALVEGWQRLEGTYRLPDINDEHVLAAAHVGGAGAIVTENLKDFPPELIPAGIEIVHPTVFTLNAVELGPEAANRAVDAMVRRSGSGGRPTRSKAELLDILEQRYDLTDAVGLLR